MSCAFGSHRSDPDPLCKRVLTFDSLQFDPMGNRRLIRSNSLSVPFRLTRSLFGCGSVTFVASHSLQLDWFE